VTTDKEGCAYVAPFGPGTYAVTVGAPGYIDSNEQGLGRSATVALNQVTPLALSIDKAATVTLKAQVPAGFTAPPNLGMRLEIPTNTTAQRALSYTGSPLLAENLYPESHQAFFGTCLRGDEYGAVQFTPAPGGSATVDVPLAPVTIVPSTGAAFPAGTVSIKRGSPNVTPVGVTPKPTDNDGKCTAGTEKVDLATGAGPLKVALPYGQWTFTFTPSSGAAKAPTITTVRLGDVPTVTVASP
jgi:hypothetical protein